MSVFVWYSKGCGESGPVLANMVEGATSGTIVPRNFAGIMLMYGATPADVFKWEDRNFQAIMNDPRKLSGVTDRRDIFNKLSENDVQMVLFTGILPGAIYANICGALGVDQNVGFVATNVSGTKHVVVTSQLILNQAVEAGMSRVTLNSFISQNRTRLFVLGGEVVGAVTKQPGSIAAFSGAAGRRVAAANGHPAELVSSIIHELIAQGLATPNRVMWGDVTNIDNGQKTAAIAAAAALGLDFCAVDFLSTDPDSTILNVVITPELVDLPAAIVASLGVAMNGWVKKNSLSPREVLKAIVEKATDEEASALLAELKRMVR
jgi:hypothetical protein